MYQRPTAEQAAILIAVMFHRSKVNSRVRLSEKTLRRVSDRKHLRLSFLQALVEELDDLGFALLQIEAGWSLIPLDQLNGAKAITASMHLADELKARKRGDDIFESLRKELGLDIQENDDEG